MLEIISDFFSDLSMVVHGYGKKSLVRKVRGGTPQGTKLGNFLFCYAINNIEKAHPTEDKVENEDQSSPEAYREEH